MCGWNGNFSFPLKTRENKGPAGCSGRVSRRGLQSHHLQDLRFRLRSSSALPPTCPFPPPPVLTAASSPGGGAVPDAPKPPRPVHPPRSRLLDRGSIPLLVSAVDDATAFPSSAQPEQEICVFPFRPRSSNHAPCLSSPASAFSTLRRPPCLRAPLPPVRPVSPRSRPSFRFSRLPTHGSAAWNHPAGPGPGSPPGRQEGLVPFRVGTQVLREAVPFLPPGLREHAVSSRR